MGVSQFLLVLTTAVVTVSSLPIRTTHKTVTIPPEALHFDFENLRSESFPRIDNVDLSNVVLDNDSGRNLKNTDSGSRNNIREGMTATKYEIKLTPNLADGTFTGVATISVQVSSATVANPLKFYFTDLTVVAVRMLSNNVPTDVASFNVFDGILEIKTGVELTLYTLEIEYSGTLAGAGIGFYRGAYDTQSYLAMNLHPTNARRVFPCIDEPNIQSTVSFTFAGLNTFQHVTANSKRLAQQANENEIQFEPLAGSPHLWGMVAHSLTASTIPTSNVVLYTRPDLNINDQQSNVAISSYFNFFKNFTAKPYDTIIANQEGQLHIMALPDIDREWYALSTICIWEPYIAIDVLASAKQKQMGFVKIAEAIARQWFGYVLAPRNWKYEWVLTGLGRYTAFEAAKRLEANPEEPARIDMEAVFLTDVIQESLLYDSYSNALPLEPAADIFNENDIRTNINGLMKTKAPAIIRMLRLVLSQDSETDYVREAARTLFNTAALANVDSKNFYDTLSTSWNQATTLIANIQDFITPWILNNNYPVIRVDIRQGSGVIVTQERFGFASRPQMNFMVPLSFTTRVNPDFNNIYPSQVMSTSATIPMELTDDDWVIFNIQGQGYYRVNYETALWNRIIKALEDELQREQIHPNNRASVLDDALNLARSGRIEYPIALRIVLTLNLETEYVVWKSFSRNLQLLKNHLQAHVDATENLDKNIYLRLINRLVTKAETNLTFTPDLNLNEPAMHSLSRGLIMDIACRANHQACVAAAVDWFRDPSDSTMVNSNIPADLRPAVFCANVMTGGEDERTLLNNYLANTKNQYDRVVILESLACSQDETFIRSYLEQTIAVDSPHNSEEKIRIFKAIVESNFKNARTALTFLIQNTAQIRDAYGGPEKLEDILYVVSRNLVPGAMVTDYSNWVNSLNSNLGDSRALAERLVAQVNEDMVWNEAHVGAIYDWIDKNNAPTLMLSMALLCVSVFMTLFN